MLLLSSCFLIITIYFENVFYDLNQKTLKKIFDVFHQALFLITCEIKSAYQKDKFQNIHCHSLKTCTTRQQHGKQCNMHAFRCYQLEVSYIIPCNHLTYRTGMHLTLMASPYHFGSFDQPCHFRHLVVLIFIHALIRDTLFQNWHTKTVLSYSANMSY